MKAYDVIQAKLRPLYALAEQWTAFSELESLLRNYFDSDRSSLEGVLYRERKGPLKKLRDEIVPFVDLMRHLQFSGLIRFNSTTTAPDCWTRSDGGEERALEVTVAQARAQVELAREMNETGVGRGFSSLQDDAPQNAFDAKRRRGRVMYATTQAQRVVKRGISRALAGKNKPRYSGMDLLVEAPLQNLHKDRWGVIVPELREEASALPFQKVYVVGGRDADRFIIELK